MFPQRGPQQGPRRDVWLVRHGETADNARRIFQGQSGGGLNRLGRAQADRLAHRLRASAAKVGLIVASDLERAVETARILGTAVGLEPELDADLREVDLGAWSGLGYDDVRTRFPEQFDAWLHGIDVRRGGGETYGEVADRVDRALRRAVDTHTGAWPIVAVLHGGAIKSWVARTLGLEGDGWSALGGAANCGITVVELGRSPKLHSWNDVSHLDGLAPDEYSD